MQVFLPLGVCRNGGNGDLHTLNSRKVCSIFAKSLGLPDHGPWKLLWSHALAQGNTFQISIMKKKGKNTARSNDQTPDPVPREQYFCISSAYSMFRRHYLVRACDFIGNFRGPWFGGLRDFAKMEHTCLLFERWSF